MGKLSSFLAQHTPALRWWLMFTSMCVGGYFVNDVGIFERFLEIDLTHISLIIFSLFVLFTVLVGYDTYRISKAGVSDNICARAKVGWFFSDAMMTLGMLGTVLGFIMMLEGDITVAKTALASMSRGMGVALYTTAAGVVCGLLLKIQLFNLSVCIEAFEEKKNTSSCSCKG